MVLNLYIIFMFLVRTSDWGYLFIKPPVSIGLPCVLLEVYLE